VQVKIIRPVNIKNGPIIPLSEVLKVRVFSKQFLDFYAPYQVIDGNYIGHFIPRENCIEYEEEKTYNEKQVKVMKDFHKKELEQAYQQKERAQQLVIELTESMKKKNAEINSLEFCVNVLAGSLSAMTEAFHKLKALEKFKNR
jgi:hypothetical protein